MDTVVFTGRISEHELQDERPVEYARLVEQGRLQQLEAPAPKRESLLFGRILGTTGVVLGLITIGLILFGAIF
jgi:hypothetical protein